MRTSFLPYEPNSNVFATAIAIGMVARRARSCDHTFVSMQTLCPINIRGIVTPICCAALRLMNEREFDWLLHGNIS